MKLTFPLLNTTIRVPVDDSVSGGKPSRRSVIRKKIENKVPEVEKVQQKVEEILTPESKVPPQGTQEKVDEKVTPQTATQGSNQPLLMAEVVNITHEKFRQTEEIKVY